VTIVELIAAARDLVDRDAGARQDERNVRAADQNGDTATLALLREYGA
jgi:hypothetical protein